MSRKTPLVLNQILGRNGTDPPQDLPQNMAQEVLNMDFVDGSLGRKRLGASAVTLNGFTAGGRIDSLGRYLLTDDETAAELHAIESGDLTKGQRLAGGTTWAQYTLANAIQANSTEVDMVSFNGKLFQAYNSSVNRLHVYPSAGGTHRRAGFEVTPGAPTISSVVAGAITDTRKWAICWTEQVSGVTVRRSNIGTLSSSQALTAQKCDLTIPTAPGDGETHWELYGYSSTDSYTLGYLLATTAIATTSITENTATLAGAAPPVSGANTPFPSVKYLLTDGTHLIGAGAWETSAGTSVTPSTRLVCWTPALGSSSTDGDDERLSNTTDFKTYLYVDAGITGMGGPLSGSVYIFGYRNVWKLVPTGEAASAYQRVTLRSDIGCIRHKSICIGEDEEGRPSLYWMSHVGPYRVGAGGIQYIGRDIEDRFALINLGATSVPCFSLFFPDRHQVWFFVSINSNNDPNEIWVYDCRKGRVIDIANVNTLRYGWSRWTGTITEARCGILFANTLGAAMSRDTKPYIGRTGTGISNPTLWKCDNGSQDGSANYQGYLITKDFAAAPGRTLRMEDDAYLLAKTQSGTTITLTTNRDFSAETATSTVLLTAAASETRALLKCEGAAVSQASYVNFQIGDAAAANTGSWVLDGFITPITEESPV